jgi:hypothetical protein
MYEFEFDSSLDRFVFERGEALHLKAVSLGGRNPYGAYFGSALAVFFTIKTNAIFNMWREDTGSKISGKGLWYPDGVQSASVYRVDKDGQVWIRSQRVPVAIINIPEGLK